MHLNRCHVMLDCLRSYCLVKLRGFAHLVAPGLLSMMLLCMIVKLVGLVDRKDAQDRLLWKDKTCPART